MEQDKTIFVICNLVSLLTVWEGAIRDMPWVMWPSIAAFGISHFMYSLLVIGDDADD